MTGMYTPVSTWNFTKSVFPPKKMPANSAVPMFIHPFMGNMGLSSVLWTTEKVIELTDAPSFLRSERDRGELAHVLDLHILVLVHHVPAHELSQLVSEAQCASRRPAGEVLVHPFRVEDVESGGQGNVEEPGLGEAQGEVLSRPPDLRIQGQDLSSTEQVALGDVRHQDELVGRAEPGPPAKRSGLPLFHRYDHVQQVRVGPGFYIDIHGIEIAKPFDLALGELATWNCCRDLPRSWPCLAG